MATIVGFLLSMAILLFGIAGAVLIAIFGKKQPGRISAAGVFTGILFSLTAFVGLISKLSDGSFIYGLSKYTIIAVISIAAYIAVAIFAFVRLRPAYMAIPLGILMILEGFWFIDDLLWMRPWDWELYEYSDMIYYLTDWLGVFAYLLCVIALLIMFITAFTSMKKRGLGIVAGIFASLIYIGANSYWPFNYAFYALTNDYFEFSAFVQRFLYNAPYFIMGVALFTLGITMFKTSPKADKKICVCGEAPVVPEKVQQEAPASEEPAQKAENEEAAEEFVKEADPEEASYEPVPEAEAEETFEEPAPEKAKESEAAPSVSADTDKVAHDLVAYKKMLDDGLINEADFEAKKKQILGL